MRPLIVTLLAASAASCTSGGGDLEVSRAATVLVGDELVAVDDSGHAATWSLDGSTWSDLPAAPVGSVAEPAVVRTGDATAVLVGMSCEDRHEESATISCSPGTVVAAEVDLTTRTWRELPASHDAPFAPEDRAASVAAYGWDGEAVVGRVDQHLWRLEPGSSRWSVLPDPPLDHWDTVCVAPGIVTIAEIAERADLDEDPSLGAAWQRERGWSGPERAPGRTTLFAATGTCDDDGNVYSLPADPAQGDAAVFRSAAASWEPLPGPTAPIGNHAVGLWTDGRLLMSDQSYGLSVYDPATGATVHLTTAGRRWWPRAWTSDGRLVALDTDAADDEVKVVPLDVLRDGRP